MRDDGFDQDGSNEDGKKWLNFKYMLNVDKARFAQIGWRIKKSQGYLQSFWSEHLKEWSFH